MPGLAVSSSCMARVSGLMSSYPERRSARGISPAKADTAITIRTPTTPTTRRGDGGALPEAAIQSTAIVADSVTEKPLSPLHWKARVPLSVAIVENTMKGLAAIAG
jgi:hypothetical protein